jgi:hypothetical protein
VFQHFPADAQRERPLEQALKRRQSYPEAAQRIVSIRLVAISGACNGLQRFACFPHLAGMCVCLDRFCYDCLPCAAPKRKLFQRRRC